jgi:hypothetical protein
MVLSPETIRSYATDDTVYEWQEYHFQFDGGMSRDFNIKTWREFSAGVFN